MGERNITQGLHQMDVTRAGENHIAMSVNILKEMVQKTFLTLNYWKNIV